MTRVVLRTDADADLAPIFDYSVAQFGRETAIAYIRGIQEVFDLLEDHQQAGACVKTSVPDCAVSDIGATGSFTT